MSLVEQVLGGGAGEVRIDLGLVSSRPMYRGVVWLARITFWACSWVSASVRIAVGMASVLVDPDSGWATTVGPTADHRHARKEDGGLLLRATPPQGLRPVVNRATSEPGLDEPCHALGSPELDGDAHRALGQGQAAGRLLLGAECLLEEHLASEHRAERHEVGDRGQIAEGPGRDRRGWERTQLHRSSLGDGCTRRPCGDVARRDQHLDRCCVCLGALVGTIRRTSRPGQHPVRPRRLRR